MFGHKDLKDFLIFLMFTILRTSKSTPSFRDKQPLPPIYSKILIISMKGQVQALGKALNALLPGDQILGCRTQKWPCKNTRKSAA
jgi:hypothetical protein